MVGNSATRNLHCTPVVLPVRFIAGGQALQCTTRELSVEGAWISCPVPPASGTAVAMRLYLPGEVTPEELHAVVRSAVASGDPKHRGFWAEFQPGAQQAQDRIAQYLIRLAQQRGLPPEGIVEPPDFTQPRMTPLGLQRLTPPSVPKLPAVPRGSAMPAGFEPLPPGAERRNAPRLDSDRPVAVRFATVEEFVLEYAANISAGGVFIRSSAPPPLQTTLRVRLELPDGGPAAEVTGLVVHRVTVEQSSAPRESGAGVRFVRPDAAFTSRIEKFLDWALSQKGKAL